MADELEPVVKAFIVHGLACFDDPTLVVRDVKEKFGLTISRQAVHYYDADRKGAAEIDEQWRSMFAETRQKWVDETAEIGIKHRLLRVRRYQRIADRAAGVGQNPNPVLEMQALEAIAKEMGGAFTNRRELSGGLRISHEDALGELE